MHVRPYNLALQTNDLLQGQRGLFLASKVLTLSNGYSRNVFGLFNFTGDMGEDCVTVCWL